jgi:uncharacterized protein (DUF2235 family)
MALYAFDGTGNEDREGAERDTNVLDFFNGYDDPSGRSMYWKGIGTRTTTHVGKGIGEAFGIGGFKRINEALRRLKDNITAGDSVIDIVGFSRGAALAISFANKVADRHRGMPIRFIGVWDIVGQFGVPGEDVNAGHNLRMPANVQRCYHAMALDEQRAFFPLTRLAGTGANEKARLVEVWFRGVHSDVGGGNGNRGLNWIALNWMFENAKREGLPIKPEAVEVNLRDRTELQAIRDHKIDLGGLRKIRDADLIHVSVRTETDTPRLKHNNPSVRLARIDDNGVITVAAGPGGILA